MMFCLYREYAPERLLELTPHDWKSWDLLGWKNTSAGVLFDLDRAERLDEMTDEPKCDREDLVEELACATFESQTTVRWLCITPLSRSILIVAVRKILVARGIVKLLPPPKQSIGQRIAAAWSGANEDRAWSYRIEQLAELIDASIAERTEAAARIVESYDEREVITEGEIAAAIRAMGQEKR